MGVALSIRGQWHRDTCHIKLYYQWLIDRIMRLWAEMDSHVTGGIQGRREVAVVGESERNMFMLQEGQKRGGRNTGSCERRNNLLKKWILTDNIGRKASDGIRKEKWPNICEIKPLGHQTLRVALSVSILLLITHTHTHTHTHMLTPDQRPVVHSRVTLKWIK